MARTLPDIVQRVQHARWSLLACGVMVSLAAVVAVRALAGAAPSPVEGVLAGLCEASTIVPWNDGYLVGDNETSDRLFAFGPDLAPRGTVPVPDPVEDIESIARAGDRVWVVGSQSATKKGKRRLERERLAILGEPPHGLDLSICAACEAARGRAPNDGGLNIEGTVLLDGRPWVGLRGPIVDGKALLLRLTTTGTKADRMLAIDLGGLAIRELSPWRGGILVVAGPVADDPIPHRLYWLRAPDATPLLLPVELPPSTEGIAVDDGGMAVIVTDGSGKAGSICEAPSTWKRIRLAEPPTP